MEEQIKTATFIFDYGKNVDWGRPKRRAKFFNGITPGKLHTGKFITNPLDKLKKQIG